MNSIQLFKRSALAVWIAAGGAISVPVVAAPDQRMEEVVVIEAPIQRRQVERSIASGMKTEVIELRRRVSYADLDLRLHEDVMTLQHRIEATAGEACDALEKMYPIPRADSSDRQNCIKRAIESARPDLDTAIASVGRD